MIELKQLYVIPSLDCLVSRIHKCSLSFPFRIQLSFRTMKTATSFAKRPTLLPAGAAHQNKDKRFNNLVYKPNPVRTQLELPVKKSTFRVIRSNTNIPPVRDCKRKNEIKDLTQIDSNNASTDSTTLAASPPASSSCGALPRETKKVCLERSRSTSPNSLRTPSVDSVDPMRPSSPSSSISSPTQESNLDNSPSQDFLSSSLPPFDLRETCISSPPTVPSPSQQVTLGKVNWDQFFSVEEVAAFGLTTEVPETLNISQEEEELFKDVLTC
jgi:hypothetical protein